MSAPFLTTKIPGMRIAVEIAWGADLTDLTGASWTWDDVTADVLLEKDTGVSITLGRPDFSQETQTAVMTCQLDNRSSAYSEGGTSPHWPHVKRGTPVRVRVSADDGATWSLRFQGSANGFTPQWDPETGRWATVELSASGPLRRLNQGTGLMISAMREGTLADPSVVVYLPIEDRQYSTFIAPAVGSAPGRFLMWDPAIADHVDGAPGDCASYGNMAASAPFVTLVDGGEIVCDVPNDATSNAATVSLVLGNITDVVPYDGATLNWRGTHATGCLFTVYTESASSVKAWDVAYTLSTTGVPGYLKVYGYPNATRNFAEGTVFETVNINFWLKDNATYNVGLILSQSGSTTTWQLFTREIGSTIGRWFRGTQGGNSNGAVITDLDIGSYSDAEGLAAGHLVVRDIANPVNGQFDGDEAWSNGYPGETVTDRLERLCESHGIRFTLLDSSVPSNTSITETMGPQHYDTLTNLLRECERTGQGVLYDGLAAGLTYITKERRASNANGPAALVINAAAAQLMEPFAPIDDDQLTINHVDVSRRGGTTQVHEDVTGPVGMDAIGDYATSYTVNCATDTGLARYAQWTVGAGTQQGYRYPTVSFALETNPSLIAGWLACTPQSRVDVTNVATIRRQHPDETIKLMLEGWHEEIDAFTWRVTANTTSATPWNVIRAAAATGSTGDGICHLDTDSSQLAASVAAGASSISVRTNSGPRWVTSSEDADSFPFDIDLGGIKATVTAVSGTTSPQTFTLATPLPRAFTGSTTAGAGTPIRVWRPPVLGL